MLIVMKSSVDEQGKLRYGFVLNWIVSVLSSSNQDFNVKEFYDSVGEWK